MHRQTLIMFTVTRLTVVICLPDGNPTICAQDYFAILKTLNARRKEEWQCDFFRAVYEDQIKYREYLTAQNSIF